MDAVASLPIESRKVTLREVSEFADSLEPFADNLRESILAPRPRKVAPVYTISELAEMCNLSRQQIQYLVTKDDQGLPRGTLNGSGRSRTFTLAEARQWVKMASDVYQTSLGEEGANFKGKILTTAQLKGGSAKTTTTVCLAQALTLLGRKVLLIDLDPQASASELCGLYAEKEITGDDTVLAYIYDQNIEGGLSGKVQTTYWDGLDIIPGHTFLYGAEFLLPAKQKTVPGFRFWAVLREGLEPLRSQYDYILIDTSPSLSYMNLNALLAADALVMPMVPENLDFISSLAFWRLFSDVAEDFLPYEEDKCYEFISILLSRVDYGKTSSAPVVRQWAQSAYGRWLDPFEIPASSVMSGGALSFSTALDVISTHSTAKSLQRVKQPMMRYANWLDDMFIKSWKEVA
ncbi:ParA family protein [Paraburkholderia hospita]|uniref:ParA family protein n=1 Tax=Paraburkholderia hospita TaxID=169430 RepID=UPI0008A78042|nr:ParA family protein [Paraburkholderia hospita]SEI14636.1 chromosome partitioning protein [Paraburkholderia hospita]